MHRLFRFRRLAALLAAACLFCAPSHAATLAVNTTADTVAADGKCTLREAITASNLATATADCPNYGAAWGTNDTIGFDIPPATDPGCNVGTGVCVIQPGSTLPYATNTVIIDGYTQPNASPNTLAGTTYPNAQAIDAVIKIELDGTSAGAGIYGLVIDGANSVVQGLSIVNVNGQAIAANGSGSLIAGNFIGVHADGVTVGGNGTGLALKLSIQVGSATVAARRNLIAGNIVGVYSNSTSAVNVIAGNLIGTDRTGAQSLASSTGVWIRGSSDDIRDNVIAGGNIGLWLTGARYVTVHGNAIGIGVGGAVLGNSQQGVMIENDASNATVGNNIYSNGIANNSLDGIAVRGNASGDAAGNRFYTNSIWNNGGLGINLQPSAEANGTVTLNDLPANLDADTGPNGLQNFPVITSATVNGTGGVDIAFTLDSSANGSFAISAYANDACDVSGYGEGRYFGGGTPSYSTDANGHLANTRSYAAMPAGWASGKYVTLLAHDNVGNNTSEFSACMQIAAAPNLPPVANNDSYNAAFNTALNVLASGVLINDSDPDSNPLTAVLNAGPTHAASFTLNSNGSFSYTPVAGYSGPDSFTYYANDGTVSSTTPATVSITVGAAPPPVVTSYTGPTATGAGSATASFTGGGAGCTYTKSVFIAVSGGVGSPAGSAPAGYAFPDGLFDFVVSNCTPGSTISMTITFPQPISAGAVYWKYGPTAGNASPHWYQLPASINGNAATFNITDGGLGDDDLLANGSIVDQGGPGVPGGGAGTAGIPTLSEWALLLLAGLVSLVGAASMRRREI